MFNLQAEICQKKSLKMFYLRMRWDGMDGMDGTDGSVFLKSKKTTFFAIIWKNFQYFVQITSGPHRKIWKTYYDYELEKSDFFHLKTAYNFFSRKKCLCIIDSFVHFSTLIYVSLREG